MASATMYLLTTSSTHIGVGGPTITVVGRRRSEVQLDPSVIEEPNLLGRNEREYSRRLRTMKLLPTRTHCRRLCPRSGGM
jgi:hypothetical protein